MASNQVSKNKMSDSESQNVSYELRESVAWLGLNRPTKRNAIDNALLEALAVAIRRAAVEARAVVLFGHGLCFCAGLDLVEHKARTAAEVFYHSRRWHEVFTSIKRGPIPAVALLHGATVGGGLELAASCHVRVADQTAFFALPEGQRGIYVGGGASVNVARLLGAARMTDMMLTGRVLDASEAERAGLAQYVVPQGQAQSKAAELAAKIATMAPLTCMAVLQALPRIQDMSETDGLFVESLAAALVQSGPEAVQLLSEFAEKRGTKVARPDNQ
jgi:enoyl-CoA hydratase/carnithine racemase